MSSQTTFSQFNDFRNPQESSVLQCNLVRLLNPANLKDPNLFKTQVYSAIETARNASLSNGFYKNRIFSMLVAALSMIPSATERDLETAEGFAKELPLQERTLCLKLIANAYLLNGIKKTP